MTGHENAGGSRGIPLHLAWVRLNERDDMDPWQEDQIDQEVEDFSDWAAMQESPLSEDMAEFYLSIKDFSEPVRQAIREYAQDFGVDE